MVETELETGGPIGLGCCGVSDAIWKTSRNRD
jgi:hypothetical protein